MSPLLTLCQLNAKIHKNLPATSIAKNLSHDQRKDKGLRHVITHPSGRNMTVCAAISSQHGIIHFKIYMKLFCVVLQAVSASMMAEHGSDQQAYFILDNAPALRNMNALGGTLTERTLPKYSGFLHSIDYALSSRNSKQSS